MESALRTAHAARSDRRDARRAAKGKCVGVFFYFPCRIIMLYGLKNLGLILLVIQWILEISVPSVASAGEALLSWNPNTEPDLAGYRVDYGTASRSYQTSVIVGNQTTHLITGLGNGVYYFAVLAYDTSGNQSDFSEEVSKDFGNPPLPPTPLPGDISQPDPGPPQSDPAPPDDLPSEARPDQEGFLGGGCGIIGNPNGKSGGPGSSGEALTWIPLLIMFLLRRRFLLRFIRSIGFLRSSMVVISREKETLFNLGCTFLNTFSKYCLR